ncbi:MAG: hypothetical protein AAB036_01545 [Elusimicrobiota bacterium]
MKTLSSVIAALLLLSPAVHADPFADFQTRARSELIKPFALDLGGLLGSASAHTGRTIGFPGFWAGIVAGVQTQPDKDNLILRNAGVKAFGLPMVEVGVGLPFKVDVVAHGVKAYDASIFGAGLRYGLYRTELLTTFLPNLSVSAFADRVNHKYFSATHGSFNAAATWDLPIVKPFLAAGLDITRVKVGSASTAGVTGLTATARGSRYSLGAELSPFPFARVRGAYTVRHGRPGFDFGLGAAF